MKTNNNLKPHFWLHSPANKHFLTIFEGFLKARMSTLTPRPYRGQKQLLASINYTLFSKGKRFRPLLVFHTARACGLAPEKLLFWAASVEMIHSASLIHDDLPAMDNALARRGGAANHRLFGEDIALLAGNCLWIEAFRIIPGPYTRQLNPILSRAAGFEGLMGGQALDLKPSEGELYYQHLHMMKTGALIAAAVEGAIAFSSRPAPALHKTGELLGQAFQLADDLEDFKEDKTNAAKILGKKNTQKKLYELSSQILKLMAQQPHSQGLKKLVLFNSARGGVFIKQDAS